MSTSPPTQPGEPRRPPPRVDDTQPRLRPDPIPPAIQVGGSVSGDVAGRDVHKTTTAGRDVVGRDVVTTTNVGFPIQAVQRLVITVGVLVFATAFCFFSSGFVLGGAALAALNRPVASSPEAAVSFGAKLHALQQLPPGQTVSVSFTEDEISSYFRFVLGPGMQELDISEGKVRLLDDGRLAVGGYANRLGGVHFAATFAVTDEIGQPLDLTAAAVQVLPTRGTLFGWVAVPTVALSSVEQGLNSLFGNIQIRQIVETPDVEHSWIVTAVGH
jgi:hypothetical protein